MNRKEQLRKVFNEAWKYNCTNIAVEIETRGMIENEIIINPRSNFEAKEEYYENSYDDDLRLKSCNEIRIVGACAFDDEIEFAGIIDMLEEKFNQQ